MNWSKLLSDLHFCFVFRELFDYRSCEISIEGKVELRASEHSCLSFLKIALATLLEFLH